MLLCLRCNSAAMTAQTQAAVLQSLQTCGLLQDVVALMTARLRAPFPSEWPIVGCGDLNDVAGVKDVLLVKLKEVLGFSEVYKVRWQDVSEVLALT